MKAIIGILVMLVIGGLAAYLLYWLIDQIPVAPFQVVARVLLALVIVVVLLGLIFGYVPVPHPAWLGVW